MKREILFGVLFILACGFSLVLGIDCFVIPLEDMCAMSDLIVVGVLENVEHRAYVVLDTNVSRDKEWWNGFDAGEIQISEIIFGEWSGGSVPVVWYSGSWLLPDDGTRVVTYPEPREYKLGDSLIWFIKKPSETKDGRRRFNHYPLDSLTRVREVIRFGGSDWWNHWRL